MISLLFHLNIKQRTLREIHTNTINFHPLKNISCIIVFNEMKLTTHLTCANILILQY